MPTEIRMPQLGESVTEGTVVRWLKQPGDPVALDESLAEIETEKVNVEIPSPFQGTMAALLVPEGETVAVGVPIATIEESGAPAGRPATVPVPEPAATVAAPTVAQQGSVHGGDTAPRRRPATHSFAATGPLGPASRAHGMFSTGESGGESAVGASGPRPAGTTDGDQIGASVDHEPRTNGADMSGRFSPAVLRLACEHDVDLKLVNGTGAGGRISRRDVQAFVDTGGPRSTGNRDGTVASDATGAAPVAQPVADNRELVVAEVGDAFMPPEGAPPVVAPSPLRAPAPAVIDAPRPLAAQRGSAALQPLEQDEELEPLTPTRRAIANHMVQSVRTAPHAWMMIETDLTRLVQFRERVRGEFRAREGVDLTYLPFMVKAVVSALKQNPRLNSSWSDEGVIIKRRINIGIAVDSPQGLVVPVLHDADNLSIAGLARAIHDLVERARARKLRIEDVQDGTFTVDNVGPIGSIVSQPIINQPQCAIVTMESIIKRPVVLDDAIAIRSMMNCCISFDHRIVDGGDIGPFMKTLKQGLESMGTDTPLY